MHKLIIYITREVFVRHTVSRNLKKIHVTPHLLIHTRHHVVPKSIGKDRQTKTRTHVQAERDDDRFSGRDTTSNRWDCCVTLDGRAVCFVIMLYQNMKTRTDFQAKRNDDRFSGHDTTSNRWGSRVVLDGWAVSGGMFHVSSSTWHPSYTDSSKNLFRRPWWRVCADF